MAALFGFGRPKEAPDEHEAQDEADRARLRAIHARLEAEHEQRARAGALVLVDYGNELKGLRKALTTTES